MKEYVSTRWLGVISLIIALSALCVLAVHYGLYGVLGSGLAFAATALWILTLLSRKAGRTVWQVIDEVEAEPLPVAATLTARGPGIR